MSFVLFQWFEPLPWPLLKEQQCIYKEIVEILELFELLCKASVTSSERWEGESELSLFTLLRLVD